MERRRENIAIPGSATSWANAYVLKPSIHCRKLIFVENPVNGAATGLQFQYINDNFANVHVLEPGEPVELGSQVGHGGGAGRIIGTPGYNSGNGTIPPTTIALIISNGGATAIRVDEWD